MSVSYSTISKHMFNIYKENIKGKFSISENYCDEQTGDAYKPHPYTCKKFVRCRPDRMDVYECPKNTCFMEDVSQCDLINYEYN